MVSNKISEDDYRMISEIQHFVFCRRQWALIHIEQQWSDNYLTTAGTIMHDRVHSKDLKDIRKGVLTIRGMRVKSSELGVSGECDAVEFVPSEDGITLHGRSGLWQPYPVEYKRGKTKLNDCDRLQVTAQAVCLEEMFSHPIDIGYIFYGETRHREEVPITKELREKLQAIMSEMHKYARDGYTPKAKFSDKCKSCSLYEICVPELFKHKESAWEYTRRHMEELCSEKNA